MTKAILVLKLAIFIGVLVETAYFIAGMLNKDSQMILNSLIGVICGTFFLLYK